MTVVIVVILHQLLILHVSVLLLDSVQLVSKSDVIFVSLLDLEKLSFELRNEKIFLVTCQVDGVIVL